jgi:subtilisin family serine protease
VAVLDTGVYYSGKVKEILGADLDHHFLGQADFVGNGSCVDGGDQFSDHCWQKKDKSRDTYGHGSHVTGIIWSQIVDYATNVTMGIAPESNILSVRVLGEDGTGTYEDVIEGIQYVVEHKNRA